MSSRILIVDDETNVRLNYRITLETEGYEVFEASTSASALQELIERPFALAILDLRMPGMDGLELLAKMREVGITVPATIVTAYSDVPNAVKAMKLGAIDFLQKPLRPEDLRRIVAEILKRHELRNDHPAETFNSHIVAAKRCLNLRSFALARIHLAKALELNTKSVEAFNLAGVLAEMLDDYDKAKKYYGQAIKIDKNYEPAQQNMRRLFELQHFGSSSEPFNLGGT
ncbi:MAG TPA: response regulator [Chthoniobacterales bacterium]|nr:response regulator [Chthoniobacterales bacterium]